MTRSAGIPLWLRALLLLCAAAVSSCSSAPPLTQIMVMVRSNIDTLDHVEIRVEGLGKVQSATADIRKQKLPRTLAVVYRGGPLGPITIHARGLSKGTLVVERSARLFFVRDHDVTLVLDLVQACAPVSCTATNTTCIDGACVPNTVSSKKLKDWPGAIGKVNAGTIYVGGDAGTDGGDDAGPHDAGDGGELDAGDAATDANVDSGKGVITGCDANHVDCDHDKLHICETAINTLSHCGACKDTCDFDPGVVDPQGTLSCPKRVCKVSCPTNRIDFDGRPETGCEGTAFSLIPSHVDVTDPALIANVVPLVKVDCDQTVDFASGALPATVQICNQDVKPLLVTQVSGPDLVVVPVISLDVTAGHTLMFAGARPVVLVVFGDAAIDGTVSVSAQGTTPGPGGNVSCTTGVGAASGNSAGAGGGGFGSNGAGGGNSSTGPNGAAAGGTEVAASLETLLRGGCPGGVGGTGANGGAGGGALQVSVAGTLSISGTLAAGGGGGVASTGFTQGGGGGGSGGALLIEATTLDVAATAWLTANGGGGGEGSSNGNLGNDAADGNAASNVAALGGSGGAGNGGDGGNGASTASASKGSNGSGNLLASGGGGGGGGGGGRVVLHATTCGMAGNASPAADVTQCM